MGDVRKLLLHGECVRKTTDSLLVLAFGCFATDLVTGRAGAGPRPPREPRPPVEPRPPRDVLPPRADPPREEPPRPPRPRPCAEPPRGAVPDGAEPEGDKPSGVAGPGDEEPVGAAPDGGEPGGDAPSPGAGGLTPPGEAGLSTPGASPEGPGAPSAGGDDPARLSPRSRSVVSRICSRRSIKGGSPTAWSGESESIE